MIRRNRWAYVKQIPDRQGDRHNVDAPEVEWRDACVIMGRTCGQSVRQAARRVALDSQMPGSGGSGTGGSMR